MGEGEEELWRGDALFAWFADCQRLEALSIDDTPMSYYDLCDGQRIHTLVAYITSTYPPTPRRTGLPWTMGERVANLSNVLLAMLTYYRDHLHQLVVMPLPDLLSIARHPRADGSKGEMKKVLLLLLGCAVQSDKKEEFVNRIKELEITLQKTIVEQIQKITTDAECVLNLQALEIDATDGVAATVLHQLQRVVNDRDAQLVTQSETSSCYNGESTHAQSDDASASSNANAHTNVEVAAVRADLRGAHNQIDELNILLAELRDELAQKEATMSGQTTQIADLAREARAAADYRDEVDCMQQKIDELNKVQSHNKKLQERLDDMHFYKGRVDELLQENGVLAETKGVLEEQMSSWRVRLVEATAKEATLADVKADLDCTRESLTNERENCAEFEYKYGLAQRQVVTLTEQCNVLQGETDVAQTPRASNAGLEHELLSSERQSVLHLELHNQKLIVQVDELTEQLKRKGNDETTAKNIEVVASKHATEMNMAHEEIENCKVTITQLQSANKLAEEQRTIDHQDWEKRQQQSMSFADDEVAQLRRDIARAREAMVDVQEQKSESEEAVRAMETQSHTMEREKRCLEKEKSALKEKLSTVEEEHEVCRGRLVVLERDAVRVGEMSGRLNELQSHNVDLVNDKRQLTSQHSLECAKSTRLSDELVECKTQLADIRSRMGIVALRLDIEDDAQFDTNVMALVVGRQRATENLQRAHDQQIDVAKANGEEIDALKQQLLNSSNCDVDYSTLADLREENRSVKLQIGTLQENIRRANDEVEQKSNALVGAQTALDSLTNERATAVEQATTRFRVQLADARSQTNLLRGDNDELQKQCCSYEAEVRDVKSTYTAIQIGHNELLADHDHLQRLHERLCIDYEELKAMNATLKTRSGEDPTMADLRRTVEGDERAIRDLQALLGKERDGGDEQLRRSAQLQNECTQLKHSHEMLRERNLELEEGRLATDCEAIADAEDRASYAQNQLAALQERTARQDLELFKTRQKKVMVEELNRTLEEECRTLLRQLDTLIAQNQELFTRALLDKDSYDCGQKEFEDKLHTLRRHKEKLEEKIVEQYKHSVRGKETFMKRAARALLPGRKGTRTNSNMASEDSCDDLQSSSNACASHTNEESDSAGEMMIHGYQAASSSSPDCSSNSQSPLHSERAIDVQVQPVVVQRAPPPPYGSQRRMSKDMSNAFRPPQSSTPNEEENSTVVGLEEEIGNELDDTLPRKDTIWYEYGCV